VDKELAQFHEQLEGRGVTLEVTDACRNWIARNGYSPEFGARNIARLVQDRIKSYFVDAVLFGDLSGGGKARADIKDDGISITTEKED